jgi:hypothetical protein
MHIDTSKLRKAMNDYYAKKAKELSKKGESDKVKALITQHDNDEATIAYIESLNNQYFS